MTLLSNIGVIALNWPCDVGGRDKKTDFHHLPGMVRLLGNDVPTPWDSPLANRSGVGPINRFDATVLEVGIAAGVSSEEQQTCRSGAPPI